MIQNGNIVEFMYKNKLTLGVCQQSSANQIRILTEGNREVNLKSNKILHTFKQSLSASASRTECTHALKKWAERLEQNSIDIDLYTFWEVLSDQTLPMDVQSLAEMYFSEAGDLETATLLRRMLDDRIYFENKGDAGFMARASEKVEQIRTQQNREEARLRSRRDTLHWIHDCLNQNKCGPAPDNCTFLEALQDVAIRGQKSSDYDLISRLLLDAGVKGNADEKTLSLMIKSGIWDEDVNLHLLEYEVPQYFSQEMLEQANQLEIDLEAALAKRQDLRHLRTVTIDDIETTDIDDAISCERLDNGNFRLWVHIADPAELVKPDTPLDQEAVRRFTSVYLCDQKIEMLPPRLSQDLCSLVQGVPRLAVSVGVELTSEAQLLEIAIHESVIEVDQRLSYQDVDQELASDTVSELMQDLWSLSQRLKQQRLDRGAMDISRPELRIKVSADKEITVKRVERDSPSQQLVSEMMVLANHLVAKQLGEVGIPLIYKVQEAPTETSDSGRPMLKRAEMSTQPALHYGLGLSAYTQFTSPIRRFNDLVLHRQIKHWLNQGTACYDEPKLQEMIAMSDQALFSANYIQRENFRYWILKYFSQLESPRIMNAVVNFIGDEKAWVHLPDYCFDLPMAAADLAGLREGDELQVSVEQLNPRKGRAAVRRFTPPATEDA